MNLSEIKAWLKEPIPVEVMQIDGRARFGEARDIIRDLSARCEKARRAMILVHMTIAKEDLFLQREVDALENGEK